RLASAPLPEVWSKQPGVLRDRPAFALLPAKPADRCDAGPPARACALPARHIGPVPLPIALPWLHSRPPGVPACAGRALPCCLAPAQAVPAATPKTEVVDPRLFAPEPSEPGIAQPGRVRLANDLFR